MRNHSIEDSKQIYGIDNWGDPYFDVNDAGNLVVRPTLGEPQSVDLKDTLDELVAKKVPLPILLRFPQLLASQVKSICESFARAIEEYEYRNVYSPVFPVKVNQRREVVQELLRAGRKYRLGVLTTDPVQSRRTCRPAHHRLAPETPGPGRNRPA